MLEIPEAISISKQLNETIKGKKIKNVTANSSNHKFAFFSGEPSDYNERLSGKTIGEANAHGGRVNIEIENLILDFADGVNLRFFSAGEKLPLKHQLFIGFEDGSALVGTISMYGCMLCDKAENLEENIYYLSAKEKISPLSDEFDYKYYESLLNEKALKLSAKGFIATEQRIPGLGNGTAQDILLNAKIHPKKKMNTLTEEQKKILFESIKNTLKEMTDCGGRDTEKDLFGTPGKYKTKLCKKTAFCQNCGGPVVKDNFLGGSIYFCLDCQEK